VKVHDLFLLDMISYILGPPFVFRTQASKSWRRPCQIPMTTQLVQVLHSQIKIFLVNSNHQAHNLLLYDHGGGTDMFSQTAPSKYIEQKQVSLSILQPYHLLLQVQLNYKRWAM